MKTLEIVVEENMRDNFFKEVTRINKKCAKIGVSDVNVIIGTTYQIKKFIDNTRFYYKDVFNVVLEIPEIKLSEEWYLIGMIDLQMSTNNMNFVHQFTDENVSEFITSECFCHHCGRGMKRNKLYIIKNDKNENKLVGSTCLKDFLGHDVSNALQLAAITSEHFGFLNRSESVLVGFTFDFACRLIYGAIFDNGGIYVSSKNDNSTKNRVVDCIGLFGSKLFPTFPIYSEVIDENIKDICEEADKLVLESTFGPLENTFDQNIAIMKSRGSCPDKMIGYLCGFIGKHWTNKNMKKNEKTSEYLGKMGDKIEIDVEIDRVAFSESSYGGYLIFGHKVGTNDRFMLYSTNQNELFVNDRGVLTAKEGIFTIKATIKNVSEHEKYGKSTFLSRGKVIVLTEEQKFMKKYLEAKAKVEENA